ncbi:50S ribosomal protein L17 [Bacteroidetes bacterium endosymbiont of Geopemphigus sp.]|uniref:50S ribosomal protein L17 n=1 Tax=Bacteroidetes bacterium endosymbiont of Geopemphigus sp. TaxID=2047937 RepID=UPI000CD25362|nr:50S ribosomal protein L17 [Bacteroidetes bacterium endosymbiont of Geopemphigus sp.]
MRHGRKINHLKRTAAHRKAMLSNMACSLIINEQKRINTTLAKAKALQRFIEPILTKSKTNSTHFRRMVFSCLQDKSVISELFIKIAPKITERPGGYTRIIKTGSRLGDGAEKALIELVDFNEIYNIEKYKKKATRRRRTSKNAMESSVQASSSEDKLKVLPSENHIKELTHKTSPEGE